MRLSDDYEDVLVPELHKALDAGQGLRTLYLIEGLEEIVTDMDWMARAEIESATA